MAGPPVHADSPAGGSGAGVSRAPGPKRNLAMWSDRHPDSPASRHFNLPLEVTRRWHEISDQVNRIATAEELEHFRSNPVSQENCWLLVRGLKLYFMGDTVAPGDRSDLIVYNISVVAGAYAGLGRKTVKWLAGDDVSWSEIGKETPQNLLALGGVALRALQEMQEFATASSGFRSWLKEANLKQLEDPITEWEPTAGGSGDSGLYEGPEKLARGNFGEKMTADALAAKGDKVLYYKPDIAGTNQGGFDLVTLRGEVPYLIDNKALTRSGNINSVSALTTNLAKNRANIVQQFTRYANEAGRPAAERAMYLKAASDIQSGNYVLAVTNANMVRGSSKILSGVSAKLQALGIQFIDVMH